MKLWTAILFGFAIVSASPPARANFYDEACQTILLKGKVEPPPESAPASPETAPSLPLRLTLSYQMSYQKAPSYLVINLPEGAAEFEVPIVGYRKADPASHYIPSIFWYPRPVTFRYYVESKDRRWKSATHQSVWHSAATKIEEAVTCTPEFYLDPLKLVKQ